MKALVLGGTGFLGSCIVQELLDRKVNVVILCRHSPAGKEPDGVRYVCGDCGDPGIVRKAMAGCDAVFHTAGYYPLYSLDCDRQAARALAELHTVLDAARRSEIDRFLFTSSPMVLVEDSRAFRRSTYHHIKRILHEEVLRWIDNGLPGMIAIPGACFGPGDRKPTTGRLVLEVARGRLPFVVEGRMNAVDARDVARAEVDMIEGAGIGSSYELGNWNCTVSEFAALVAGLADSPAPKYRLSYQPTRFLAHCLEAIQAVAGVSAPLFPAAGLDQAHFGTFLDSSGAVRELGFRARPIQTTVTETLEYFRSMGMLETSAGLGPVVWQGRFSGLI